MKRDVLNKLYETVNVNTQHWCRARSLAAAATGSDRWPSLNTVILEQLPVTETPYHQEALENWRNAGTPEGPQRCQ